MNTRKKTTDEYIEKCLLFIKRKINSNLVNNNETVVHIVKTIISVTFSYTITVSTCFLLSFYLIFSLTTNILFIINNPKNIFLILLNLYCTNL